MGSARSAGSRLPARVMTMQRRSRRLSHHLVLRRRGELQWCGLQRRLTLGRERAGGHQQAATAYHHRHNITRPGAERDAHADLAGLELQ